MGMNKEELRYAILSGKTKRLHYLDNVSLRSGVEVYVFGSENKLYTLSKEVLEKLIGEEITNDYDKDKVGKLAGEELRK